MLMVIGFPFTGSVTALLFVAWIPLLVIERDVYERRLKSSYVFIHAYIVFLIYNIGTTWWIYFASPGGAYMAFTFNSFLMTLAFYLFHFLKKKQGRSIGYFAFFVCWIGFEYVHHYWELSWPWLSFGNAFSIHPSLVQWYEWTGISGGTLWILAVNVVIFLLIERLIYKKQTLTGNYKFGLALAGIIVFPVVFSFYRYHTYTELQDPIEVVVLQPNIDPYGEKFTTGVEGQLEKLLRLADETVTSKTAVILAPETAISQGFFEHEITQHPFYNLIVKRKSTWNKSALFIGASTARFFPKKHSRASRKLRGGGFYEAYNAGLLVNEDNQREFYHKSKLVLGVEKVPFSNWLPFLEELSINNGGASGTLGIEDRARSLKTKKHSFAPLICYESIYGEFNAEQCRQGADFIAVITNDGWWEDTPGYKQHMSFSRIRAIENRRSVARSANTGISCFINQRGDVIQQTKWWEPAALRSNLNRNKHLTFYTKHGDVLGRTSFIAIVLLIGLWIFKSLQKRKANKN
jgi:apolipoprotein N-acyltransferase